MNEERARDAVEHLQGAALQLIAAFRAVLDVAEEMLRDEGSAEPVADEPKRSTRVTRIQVS